MKNPFPNERTLTRIDYARLTRLASQQHDPDSPVQLLLDNSEQVPSASVPATVITMYTQLLLRGEAEAEPQKVTLCYPADAEPAQGFISVLSPLGASLIGMREGDLAQWRTPLGEERSARIVEVLFQPEATGDYTL